MKQMVQALSVPGYCRRDRMARDAPIIVLPRTAFAICWRK